MTSPDTVRCFIAIELPDAVKQELLALIRTLRARCPDAVKWVDAGGIHLTLEFLGNVATGQVEEVAMGMEDAAQGVAPFRLEVKGVGAFPNLNRVQVAWVGVEGQLDILASLQKRIEHNMEQLGFPGEERAFTPHLTLGRVRNYARPEDRKKMGAVLGTVSFASAHGIDVTSVSLIKSQLTPAGAVYSPLATARLMTA
jgi:2'-5' RNA ligase